jgi:hypothetical protein
MALQPSLGPCRFYTQSVGLPGRGISLHTDIRTSSGIRTHDSSVRTGEVSSYFTPRGYRDRLM